MAVRDPDRPGRHALGIECDGATYHSAATARDRDRLRQDVLERLGWRLHRIWSTDWVRDPAACVGSVLRALEDARSHGDGLGPADPALNGSPRWIRARPRFFGAHVAGAHGTWQRRALGEASGIRRIFALGHLSADPGYPPVRRPCCRDSGQCPPRGRNGGAGSSRCTTAPGRHLVRPPARWYTRPVACGSRHPCGIGEGRNPTSRRLLLARTAVARRYIQISARLSVKPGRTSSPERAPCSPTRVGERSGRKTCASRASGSISQTRRVPAFR